MIHKFHERMAVSRLDDYAISTLGTGPTGGRGLEKEAVGYRLAEGDQRCATCEQRTESGCSLVRGGIRDDHVCDRWETGMDQEGSERYYVPIHKDADGNVMIFPVGPFYRDGKRRKFTPVQAQELVRNFKENILNRKNGKLPINSEHERWRGRIGYITDLLLKDGTPYAQVEETTPGVLDGFDYISPEIKWEWTHPYSGKEYQNVLMGAAATNYPFFLGQMALHSDTVPIAKDWRVSVSDTGLVSMWEPFAESDREKLRKDRDARAKRYGIAVKERSKLTPPKDYPSDAAAYGDPVNYRYPADEAHALPAVQFFNRANQREAGGYSSEEWSIIGKRIAKLASRFIKGQYEYDQGRIQRKTEGSSVSFVHEAVFSNTDVHQRIAYGVVLQPDVVDVQGHTMSAVEIEQACHKFMEKAQALDEQHQRVVTSGEAVIVESWIQREPVTWRFASRDDDLVTEILPGSWCLGVKFSEEMWEKVLSGEIDAFSVQGWGALTQIE